MSRFLESLITIMQNAASPVASESPNFEAKGHRLTVKVPDVSPVTRTAISLEYASLRHIQHCPLGIYVTPSAETLLVWDAVFFVHQGISGQLTRRASILKNIRLLCRCGLELSSDLSNRLSREPACGPVCDRYISSLGWPGWGFQPLAPLSPMAVHRDGFSKLPLKYLTYDVLHSPKEHHVFDILHYIKAAFKKHALDKIHESDCLNKEAFR